MKQDLSKFKKGDIIRFYWVGSVRNWKVVDNDHERGVIYIKSFWVSFSRWIMKLSYDDNETKNIMSLDYHPKTLERIRNEKLKSGSAGTW